MGNIIRRGLTLYARLHIPKDRQADVGRAMGSKGGLCRERVRTLETRDHREAAQRCDDALAAMREEVNAALRKAGMKPLTDWVADWMPRAIARRADMEAGRNLVAAYEQDPHNDYADPVPIMQAEFIQDQIMAEADKVAARHGDDAGRTYRTIALGDGITVAEASRRWLPTLEGKNRYQTISDYRTAHGQFAHYLGHVVGAGGAEAVGIAQVTRRLAGDFLVWRAAQPSARGGGALSPKTISREITALLGLWEWAINRGYAEINPWQGQAKQVRKSRDRRQSQVEHSRGRSLTTGEVVTILRADRDTIAPGGGRYGTTFFDLFRLMLLTGARPAGLLALTKANVWGRGDSPEVIIIHEDKTPSGRRVVPLHRHAAAVVKARLADLADSLDDAPLWPEIPPQGDDQDRTTVMSTRFASVRRRLFGTAKGIQLYSFRRTFASAAETAMHKGGPVMRDMIALIVGHKRGTMALDVYSDWSRLAEADLRPILVERMATLQAAVDSIVSLGMGDDVLAALDATADKRMPLLSADMAFRRKARRAGRKAG